VSNNDWYRFYAPRRLDLTPEHIAADSAAAEQDIDVVLERIGLAPDARILEVGCGWGRACALLHCARSACHERADSLTGSCEPAMICHIR
jgi:cyclopropane fatty-acyl-phospholipid synthase-like methyltransferase